MKLSFKIHKNHLLVHIIRCSDHHDTCFSDKTYEKDIVNLQNKAWKISEVHYNLLRGKTWSPEHHNDEILDSLSIFAKKVKRTKEFKKIFQQTQGYLKFCSEDWNNNYKFCNKLLTSLTGFNLRSKRYTVYLTHPALCNGKYLGENKITFGHHENWPHYAIVYFWHEILHSYFGKTDLDHALIEFLTDNEMRVQLNGGEYPPYMGHKRHAELKDQILPFWRKYLKKKGPRDILKFREELVKKHKIPEFFESKIKEKSDTSSK